MVLDGDAPDEIIAEIDAKLVAALAALPKHDLDVLATRWVNATGNPACGEALPELHDFACRGRREGLSLLYAQGNDRASGENRRRGLSGSRRLTARPPPASAARLPRRGVSSGQRETAAQRHPTIALTSNTISSIRPVHPTTPATVMLFAMSRARSRSATCSSGRTP